MRQANGKASDDLKIVREVVKPDHVYSDSDAFVPELEPHTHEEAAELNSAIKKGNVDKVLSLTEKGINFNRSKSDAEALAKSKPGKASKKRATEEKVDFISTAYKFRPEKSEFDKSTQTRNMEMVRDLNARGIESRNKQALVSLYKTYLDDYGLVSPDIPRAANVLSALADKGEPEATNLVGMLSVTGEGMPQNVQKAKRHFKTAAKQDIYPLIAQAASLNLGMILEGEGLPDKAEKRYKAAIEKAGSSDDSKKIKREAQARLGMLELRKNPGILKKAKNLAIETIGRDKKALSLVIEAARKGGSTALSTLGWLELTGRLGDSSVQTGLKLLHHAAGLPCPVTAVHEPQDIASTGLLDTKFEEERASLDIEKSEPLAVEEEDPDPFTRRARLQLGMIYADGIHGVKKDLDQARYCLEKAGYDADAQYHLANLLVEQKSGQQTPEAIQLLLAAADQNHSEAQYCLGRYYKDQHPYQQAMPLLYRSATQGHSKAQYLLGEMHFYGS
ncbi:hypothetical protein CAPTEDRAFT_211991, partial [Capitella teleta]